MPEATGPRFNYDEETDILYVSFAPGEQATAVVELNDNILLRFNRGERAPSGSRSWIFPC